MRRLDIFPRGKVLLLAFTITVCVLMNTKTVSGKDISNSTSLASNSATTTKGSKYVEIENKRLANISRSIRVELGWISYVLSEKLSNFRPTSRTNQQCNQQSDLYEKSLQNLTLWAMQMKEASAASTDGLLVGQLYQPGNYDECMAVQTPTVSARYCLVNIKFSPTPESYHGFNNNWLEGVNAPWDANAWETLKASKNPYRQNRTTIYWAVCVPSACSRLDIEESLQVTFADITQKYGLHINLSIPDKMCSSKVDDRPLPFQAKVMTFALVFLSLLCVLVTFYHLLLGNMNPKEEDNFGRKLLKCFSLVNSFQSLTRGSGEKNMNVLDGLKVYSTISVMITHRMFLTVTTMVANLSSHAMNWSGPLQSTHLIQHTVALDIFFVISGFLVFSSYYSPLRKHGVKIVPFIIINRWLRLIPILTFLVLCVAILLPYFGDGPVWSRVLLEAEKCQRYGWTNILGINNYRAESLDVVCVLHTWYAATDLQLFPVGIIIVYMFSKSHSLGLKVALGALAASIVIPFSTIYTNTYDAVEKINASFYPNVFNYEEHYRHVYFKSHMRAGPYILSIFAAFLLLKIRENKWTLSVSKRWLIFVINVVVGPGLQLYSVVFYIPKREYNALENALFGAFHRHLWSLIVCTVIVFQLAWGFGKRMNMLLAHKIYIPLSRLSYLVYLFGPIWQLLSTANTRLPITVSVKYMVQTGLSDIIIIYLGALWLYCIIEEPLNQIRTRLLSKIKGEGESDRNKKQKLSIETLGRLQSDRLKPST